MLKRRKHQGGLCGLVLRLTHLHVLWIDAYKRTQDVVFLISLQGFVQLLLLLRVQLGLLPLQQLLQLPDTHSQQPLRQTTRLITVCLILSSVF